MSIRVMSALALLLSCATPQTVVAPMTHATEKPKAPAGREQLHAVHCSSYSVFFMGTKPETGTPLSYGTESIEFFLDGQNVPFKPEGSLSFSDWNFNIVAPDCAHVVLQEDRTGPLRVATVGSFKKALTREITLPTVEFQRIGDAAPVISDVKWLNENEFEFFASCCGGVEVFRVDLTKDLKATRVFFAASAPHGIKRTDKGFESIK